MAIHPDLLPFTSDTERPPGVTCDDYARGEGKRCRHYAAGGGCRLPRREVCTEWLKHNPRATHDAKDAASAPCAGLVAETRSQTSDLTPGAELDALRGFTTEDIASFKALGVEVRFHAAPFGDLWLVPAYTGQARQEITPEHAATLARVLAVFPGAYVVAFERIQPPQQERPERQESRS